VKELFPETATITGTGPGGEPQADGGWGAVLPDGTPVRVFLEALVHTTKTAVLHVGDVVHVALSAHDGSRCSVDPADCRFLTPQQLAAAVAGPGGGAVHSTDGAPG